jgi:hypothetical protein
MPVTVRLSRDQVHQIHEDIEKHLFDEQAMIREYCPDLSDRVHFSCHIEFSRGRDFREEGVISISDFLKVHERFKTRTMDLGEVNGKHSEVEACYDDFSFHTCGSILEDYIVDHGRSTSYFFDEFLGDDY